MELVNETVLKQLICRVCTLEAIGAALEQLESSQTDIRGALLANMRFKVNSMLRLNGFVKGNDFESITPTNGKRPVKSWTPSQESTFQGK